MEYKRIVILANSIKKRARCIAGREIIDSSLRNWLRPISDQSEGELLPHHMATSNAAPLKVLDIVDVPLQRYANDRYHPEDWLVDVSARWRHCGEFPLTSIAGLEEGPLDLWLEPKVRVDRVTPNFLSLRQNHRSLYLIRPVDLRIELTHEQNPFKNKNQKKSRTKFRYRGQDYEMNLTDPVFTERYCVTYPVLGGPASIVRAPYGDNCLLCVSLTPVFNGYHYKVVATVLELP